MRLNVLKKLISGMFILLIFSLAYVQLVRSGTYQRLSEENTIRLVPIDAPRGRIFDRNDNILITNRISFNVACVYQELGFQKRLINALSEVLDISRGELVKRLEAARKAPFVPVTIVEDIEKEKALVLEEMALDMRGVVIETKAKRDYLYGDIGAHVFGYLSEIDKAELETLKGYGYQAKDLIGRGGLEEHYNDYLMGTDGGMQVKVDNLGRQVEVMSLREPTSGKDLYLTLDIRLQLLAEESLGKRRGAIIAMDPSSGEVLAMVSHPSFDPDIFVNPRLSSRRMRLLRDKKFPMVNRAIGGLYPPGSIFKVAVATAALETGKLSSNTQLSCSGSYSLGGRVFHCWKKSGHGRQDIKEGIKNSCNVFFYQTGRRLGVDNVETYAHAFGFGRPTRIDLPGELSGLVPGRLWKRLHRRRAWYEGETLNYAIGQGYLLVTPLQVLSMMSAIANDGNLIQPYLVRRIDSVDVFSPKSRSIRLSKRTIRIIKDALKKVVNDEDGTGKRARVKGLSIAGKTGTAQNPHGKSHGWFSGFAPFKNPKISLVVFIEHGGKGGLEASEIAGKIFNGAKEFGYL